MNNTTTTFDEMKNEVRAYVSILWDELIQDIRDFRMASSSHQTHHVEI